MNLKSKKAVSFFVFFIVGAVGVFAIINLKNTFTVENPNSVSDEPVVRNVQEQIPEESAEPEQKILALRILPTGLGYLNVRVDSALNSAKVGTVKPGEVYEYTQKKGSWYKISHPEIEEAWVYSEYVEEIEGNLDLFGPQN
jgi:hypothetical protein